MSRPHPRLTRALLLLCTTLTAASLIAAISNR